MWRIAVLACGVALFLGAQAGAAPYVAIVPDGKNVYKDSDEKSLPSGSPTQTFTTGGIKFNIYYLDVINHSGFGFDSSTNGPEARARVQDALTYIASVLHETGELDIVANPSTNSGSSTLASAGTYYSTAAGTHAGSTMERLHDPAHAKPAPGLEEIVMTVDFSSNWNFSTAPATNSEYDFQSVITHEFTHGLGFASVATSTGTSQLGTNAYTVFNTFIKRRTGGLSLFSGNPPSFHGTAADLISNDLAWSGNEAIQAFLPLPAPGIYAQSPFAGGSNLSHWDTDHVGGAVMEHAISNGETRRTYAPIDLGTLRDIGYLDATDAPVINCNLSACPDFAGQGAAFYATAAALLSQPLSYATSDLDGEGIPDHFEIALLRRIMCQAGTPYTDNAPCVFNRNRAKLANEAVLTGLTGDFDIIAGLLTVGTGLQNAGVALGLTGSYEALTDSGAKSINHQILSAGGDPDLDGLTNFQEYQNVITDGGGETEFVEAALNPYLDGTTASAENVPATGLAGIGAVLCAVSLLGAVTLRRQRV